MASLAVIGTIEVKEGTRSEVLPGAFVAGRSWNAPVRGVGPRSRTK